MELMIVVAIVAILATIAIPSYRDYVVRGQLVSATTALSANRAKMEQYFQDNRTYATVGTGSTALNPPCLTGETAGLFTVICSTPTASAYTITATGQSGSNASGFVYTIDQNNLQRTTGLPTGWGTAPYSCWIVRRGSTC